MSKRIAIVLFAAAFVAAPLRADFDSLVHAVETIPGLHRVPLPGFALIRFGVWMAHPKGVHDLQLATFEGKGSGDIDQRELERLLRMHAEAGFTPLVLAHSRRSGEVALVWARPRGEVIELLLLAHDQKNETVVLRTVVNIETFAREIADPHTAIHIARR
jgi:hypothetical protein